MWPQGGSAMAEQGLCQAGRRFALGLPAACGPGPREQSKRGAWNWNLPPGQFVFFQNKCVGYNQSGFIAEENSRDVTTSALVRVLEKGYVYRGTGKQGTGGLCFLWLGNQAFLKCKRWKFLHEAPGGLLRGFLERRTGAQGAGSQQGRQAEQVLDTWAVTGAVWGRRWQKWWSVPAYFKNPCTSCILWLHTFSESKINHLIPGVALAF